MNSDALMEFISDHHHQDLYCYVLLDPLALSFDSDHSIYNYLHDVLGESALTRVLRPDLPLSTHLHPVLACMARPGELPSPSLMTLTARAGLIDLKRRKRYVCGWLFSTEPASAIAAHLTSICHLPTATCETRFYPIFEPVRLELFAASFPSVDQGPWWPIKHWLFLTSGGKAASIDGRPNPSQPTPVLAVEMQNDSGLIESLLTAWRAMRTSSFAEPLPPLPSIAAVRASESIRHARNLGLSAPTDIQALALHMLALHPQLHTHPAVLAMIETAVREQRPLAEILAQYTDANWGHVVSTLTQSELSR